mmetsp:Transcript_63569/g.185876  ORF Transcript_63569/g.185876 Transcript_63569/m.185876 type:complete len:119 (-) Transcript_63569:547-903(-)
MSIVEVPDDFTPVIWSDGIKKDTGVLGSTIDGHSGGGAGADESAESREAAGPKLSRRDRGAGDGALGVGALPSVSWPGIAIMRVINTTQNAIKPTIRSRIPRVVKPVEERPSRASRPS